MREPVDWIFTLVWFHLLVIITGSNGQATDLAKKVEPDECKEADGGGTAIPRCWYWYRTGETGPSKIHLDQIDSIERFRGSAWLFEHPFRTLLRKEVPSTETLLANIRMLPPRHLALLFEDQDHITGHVAIRQNLTGTDLEAVQQLGHLNALTALMSLCLLARERGDRKTEELASESAFRLFVSLMWAEPFKLFACHIGMLVQEQFFSGSMSEAFETWLSKARYRLDLLNLCLQAGIIKFHDRIAQDRILAIIERFDERCGVHQLWMGIVEYQLGGQFWDPPPKPGPMLCEFVMECLAVGARRTASDETKRMAQIERVLRSLSLAGVGDRSDVRPGYFQGPGELFMPVQHRHDDQS